MNRRLHQFLLAENISQSQLADTIGVARASISHILAGRNKPGFEFIERIARHYPELSLEWLITGRGRMYVTAKTAAGAAAVLPFSGDEAFSDAEDRLPELPGDDSPAAPGTSLSDDADKCIQQAADQKHISKIIVFYSDGSFAEIA